MIEVPLFFDTTCLSHFARADRLDVLKDLLLGSSCWTTAAVRDELTIGAQRHARIGEALTADWINVAALDGLDALRVVLKWATRFPVGARNVGEVTVLAAAEVAHGIAITDDRAAATMARQHGAPVHGTLWVLARACREGRVTEVAVGNIIDALAAEGMRLPCTGRTFAKFARDFGLL
jgi:predicted nucleic acid-binding protein